MVISEQTARSPKPFRICVGNDPSLWRYDSVQVALAANCHAIASLILAGERHPKNQLDSYVTEKKEVVSVSAD